MINHEFNEKRTGLANAFAAAGAELLGYMGSSSALAAIPDTDPPKYVAAGPLKEIAKLLPAFGDAAEKPTGDLTDEQWIFDLAADHEARGNGLFGPVTFNATGLVEFTRAAIAAYLARQSQAAQPSEPTDISQRLREYAGNPGYSHNDYADTMRLAADECERFYSGMMNWKANAQAKDRTIADLRAALAGQSQATKVQAVPEGWRKAMRDLVRVLRGVECGDDGQWKFIANVCTNAEELLAAPAAQEGVVTSQEVTQQSAPDEVRQCVRDAVADALAGLYYCGRVWSAWSVGAMSQDDFSPADEDDDIIESVTDAALNAMVLANVTQQAAPVAVWTAEEIANACVKVGLGILECHGLLTTLKSIPAVTQQAAKAETAEQAVFLRQSSSFGPWIECDPGHPDAVRFVAPTTCTVSAPDEVRNAALEEAAKVCEECREDCAATIRALCTSTDQADTDTGSAE